MDDLETLDREAEDDESAMSTGSWWARRDAAIKANAEVDANYAASPEGRSEARRRKISALIALRYDSGLTAEWQADLDRLEAEQAAEDAAEDAAREAEQAAEDAEWTREITIDRRARWNALAKAGARTAREIESEVGYEMTALRRQVARHGL